MGLMAGPQGNNNILQVGWQVSPSTTKDKLTRFFVSWQVNGEVTAGCENFKCPGFVQVSRVITPGNAIQPLSQYNGKQYEIMVIIRKDERSGNWWLIFGENDAIGYWPNALFTFLANNAKSVESLGRPDYRATVGDHRTSTSRSERVDIITEVVFYAGVRDGSESWNN